MADRLKILISAYACSPVRGSEPGVGWGFVKALAEYHDLWVITEKEKFQDEIQVFLDKNPQLASRVQFYFILKKRNRPLRKIWPPSYYWYYRQWHRDALQLASQLHEEIGFDLVHQLTMVGFREPGYLWQLDIPFVWGPVGGMGYFPWRFLPVVGIKGAIYYTGYNCMNFMHSHFLKRPTKAAVRAGLGLIAATPENQAGSFKFWGCRSTVIPEAGLPCSVNNNFSKRLQNNPLKIAWTGLHTPRKALNLALKGLHRIGAEVDWQLHVLGKGEMTETWQQDAMGFGIDNRCHFYGWLEREKALAVMRSCHVLLITSLRDLTSTVTIEALALGLPIICLDHCGFSHIVSPECGIKIPVNSPGQVADAIATSITTIWQDEPLRQRLAGGALQRARLYSWKNKVKKINAIYKQRLTQP